MDEWGFAGPLIGPLKWVQTTYATQLRIEFEEADDAERYFGTADANAVLALDGDMVVFAGKFYGDWTVFHVPPEGCARPPDGFRKARRDNTLVRHRPG